MTTINIILLLIAAAATLTGFDGKKVVEQSSDPKTKRSLAQRIRPLGWLYLALMVAGLTLGIYKELTSVESRLRSVYPAFFDLVKKETTYDRETWSQLISYRLSLRFLLQDIHRKSVSARLPEGLKETMTVLGRAGALPEGLCEPLDYVRYHTYTAEWARFDGPSVSIVQRLPGVAVPTLRELAKHAERLDPSSLKPQDSTTCGTDPK